MANGALLRSLSGERSGTGLAQVAEVVVEGPLCKHSPAFAVPLQGHPYIITLPYLTKFLIPTIVHVLSLLFLGSMFLCHGHVRFIVQPVVLWIVTLEVTYQQVWRYHVSSIHISRGRMAMANFQYTCCDSPVALFSDKETSLNPAQAAAARNGES